MALTKITLYDVTGITAAIFELEQAEVTKFEAAFKADKAPASVYVTEIPIPASIGTKKERSYNLANFGSYDKVTV